jgi:hypothetical protein
MNILCKMGIHKFKVTRHPENNGGRRVCKRCNKTQRCWDSDVYFEKVVWHNES